MKRLFVVCLLTLVPVGLPAGGGAATPAKSPLSMSPIRATFVQKEFATHYTVEAFNLDDKALAYRWVLELELVDSAGRPHGSVPDSAAAVDLACRNRGKLVGRTNEFVWGHGDPPVGTCDHSKMGPQGHQGSVTALVTDGTWLCTASYEGTDSGQSFPAKCMRDDAVVPVKVRSAIAKLIESIAYEQAALDDLKAKPPRLAAAYDKVNKGRMKLHEVDQLEQESGTYTSGETLRSAWMNDLEVLWNINIPNSPYVPKSPLDVELNQQRIENALKAKERELARLQRVLRARD